MGNWQKPIVSEVQYLTKLFSLTDWFLACYHYGITKRVKQVNTGFWHICHTTFFPFVRTATSKPIIEIVNFQNLPLFQVPLYFFSGSRHFPQFSNGEFAILQTEPIPRNNFRIWPFDLMVKDTVLALAVTFLEGSIPSWNQLGGKIASTSELVTSLQEHAWGFFFFANVYHDKPTLFKYI